ncbi:MAG: phosphatidate cytidylyltransferase [Porticoccaceae bacterium]|nr:phosphatidate cytidylyltransferase [Porticoccaceae bacterium]
MLKQRVITAIILASGFLAALFYLPAHSFMILMAVVVAYGGWEWSALANISSQAIRGLYVICLTLALVLSALWLGFDTAKVSGNLIGNLFGNHLRSVLAWACAWWALALLWIQGYPSSALLWGRPWMCAAMGFVVLVPTWVALAALVLMPGGEWLVLSVVLLVALADIGAFFSGRAFGKHKLAEQVSPGKTWEGVIGGVSAIALVTVCYALFVASEQSQWWAWLLLAGTTGLASVVGDLLESMVKRHRGVKDSGSILPGHGGVLDRIDSLTAALPVFTLLYALLYEHLS